MKVIIFEIGERNNCPVLGMSNNLRLDRSCTTRIEVPDEFYEEYEQVEALYLAMQEKLEDLYWDNESDTKEDNEG